MEPIFVEMKAGDRQANARHFYRCQAESRPMIMIKLRGRHAQLSWDCNTLESGKDTHVLGERGNEILAKMTKIFYACRSKNASFNGSAFVGDISRLEPEVARSLAQDFYRLLDVTA